MKVVPIINELLGTTSVSLTRILNERMARRIEMIPTTRPLKLAKNSMEITGNFKKLNVAWAQETTEKYFCREASKY